LAVMAVLLWAMAACTVDDYESGDGRYSYTRADFAMIHTSDTARVNYMLTDDGDSVAFDGLGAVDWATIPDSMYRALVYYDVSTSRFFSATPVFVTIPTTPSSDKPTPIDPLTIESVWIGGGFLNIGFAVKTGRTDSIESRQQVGVMLENIIVTREGRRMFDIRVIHAQNGIPEYYTVRGYMSMPLTKDMQGAAIRLKVNTYEGEKAWIFFNF
jgi:hypothetical protein